MNVNTDYTKLPKKDFEIKTETGTKDLRDDGSFPNAKRLNPPLAIAVAKYKQERKFLCHRCSHHMYEHVVSYRTFLMFLFEEPISTHRFHHCSVRRCRCQHFVSEVNIRKEEAV